VKIYKEPLQKSTAAAKRINLRNQPAAAPYTEDHPHNSTIHGTQQHKKILYVQQPTNVVCKKETNNTN
jgi:hypothetical protein